MLVDESIKRELISFSMHAVMNDIVSNNLYASQSQKYGKINEIQILLFPIPFPQSSFLLFDKSLWINFTFRNKILKMTFKND